MNNILTIIKNHKIIIIPLIGLIIFLLLRTILLQKPNTELTYTIKQEDMVDTVQVNGNYMTASQTQVNSPTTGNLSKLYVSNNQQVKKGDPLFHVESSSTIDEQNTAYAAYQTALSALQTAKNTQQSLDATMWTKQQDYLDAQNTKDYKNDHTENPSTGNNYTDLEKFQIDNAVTETEKAFRAAEEAYKTSSISLNAAQAKVAQTLRSYQETQSATVTAPTNGTITNLLAKNGDQVFLPSSTNTTQPVLFIANLSNPYIAANISENYAVRIKPGQKTTIVFDGLKDQTFTGTVDDIATIGTNDHGVITYTTRISTQQLPSSIKPNMTALITIETLRINNTISVPNSAIITKEGKTYVSLAKTHKLIPVTIGTKSIAKTEITSGLSPGTTIVSNPKE